MLYQSAMDSAPEPRVDVPGPGGMAWLPGPLRAQLHGIAGGLPRVFWVLWAGMFVNRVGSFVVPFLAIYLTQARGYSPAMAGGIVSLYGAGAAVASPLGGYCADHFGRRTTMIAALVFGGLGMISLGFARGIGVIAPACFVVALLGESYRPAMQAAMADLIPPHDRTRAFALLYWVINLGVSFGFTLAGMLATHSFMLLFVGDGITSLIFAFLVWRGVPETRPALLPATPERPRAGLVRGFIAPYLDRPFAGFVLLSMLLLLVFMQHLAALPVAMTMGGVSRAVLGVVLAINGILIVFVQPPLAPRLGRRNPSRVLALGALLVGAGFGLNAFGHGALLFAGATMVWTVGEILTLPIANSVVADVARPEMRGRYQGAYGLAFGLAGFGAPLVGMSVLQRFGSSTLWMSCLLLGGVVALGHLALEPRLTRLRELRRAAQTGVIRAGA